MKGSWLTHISARIANIQIIIIREFPELKREELIEKKDQEPSAEQADKKENMSKLQETTEKTAPKKRKQK